MDVVKEDRKVVSVREEDAKGRVTWRQVLHCGDPQWEKRKKKRKIKNTDNCELKPVRYCHARLRNNQLSSPILKTNMSV